MANNHGSCDGGSDATRGTGAVTPAPVSQPSSASVGRDLIPGREGGTAHPEVIGLKGVLAGFAAEDVAGLSDADTLATIGLLETAGRMIQAQQAALTAHLIETREAVQRAKERSTRCVRSGVMRDVALHRGLNATRAGKVVDVATDAPAQAPRIYERFEAGEVSENTLVTFFDETTLLTEDGRIQADSEIADDAPYLGERDLRHRLRLITTGLEPELAAERARKAAGQRHVSVRPRPDSMSNLTALLPGAVAMAINTILTNYAKTKRAGGDERLEAQVKADALTGIIIGWAEATGHVPRSFTAAHRIKNDTPDTTNTANPANTALDTAGTAPDAAEQPGADTSPPSDGRSPGTGADAGTSPGASDEAGTGEAPAGAYEYLPGFAEVDQAREAFAAFLRAPEGSPTTNTDTTNATAASAGRAGLHTGVGVQVHLVVTDLALFGIQDTPAEIFGLGPVPANLARDMVRTATTHHTATLKRLYTHPATGALVAMESKARAFPDGLAQMISLRDKFCRHPYCDSPIKHLDHIHPHAAGGPTSFTNGQGCCARHNLIKDTGATTTPQPPTPGTNPTGSNATDPGNPTGPSDPGPTVTTESEADGTGPITTRLASGATFTSPARPFPHESPDTITSNHYWAGYRAGKAATETSLTERETTMARTEAETLDLADKVNKARSYLRAEHDELLELHAQHAREAAILQRHQADLKRLAAKVAHDQAELQRQRSSLCRDSLTLNRLHTTTGHHTCALPGPRPEAHLSPIEIAFETTLKTIPTD
jgi:hypothetical protein